MNRERYIDDYEDFEPELRIWPFAFLSFLLPLFPLLANTFLGSGFSFSSLIAYVVSVLPLLFTAIILKDGEKAWLLLVSGGLYFLYSLLLWVNDKLSSSTIVVPLALLISPFLLSVIAYGFFQKRKRGGWLGWILISIILSSLLLFLSYRYRRVDASGYLVYPFLLILLSIVMFFVTRRSESTPWFVSFIIILLVVSSITLYPGVVDSINSGERNVIINKVLSALLFGFYFWYNLSFLFVFTALSAKSSYKRATIREKEDYSDAGEVDEEFSVPPYQDSVRSEKNKYTYPPEYSRYNENEKEKRVEEKSNNVKEERERINTTRDRENDKTDDKWYAFIQSGVDERRDAKRDDSYRSRDYYDSYYEDPRRRYREDDYPSPPRRRERDDRYYDDYRERRDERDYYPPRRRDDRDYYYDDRRRIEYDDRYYQDYPPPRRRERDDRDRDYR